MIKAISIISLFLLTSCSSYINRVHKQLDREEMRQNPHLQNKYSHNKNDNFDMYRQGNREMINGANKQMMTTSSNRHAPPSTKRLYRPVEKARKRYSADDLNDNGNQASLWAGTDNQLFERTENKRNGDIILINVLGRLKNEITMELKRAFPDPPKRKKKVADEKGSAAEKPKEEAAAAAPQGGGKRVHDKISSVVIEEINDDHLLLRGRKHLLYKNRKRLIEVQALVSRKDIDDDNAIHSDNILESSVNVLR